MQTSICAMAAFHDTDTDILADSPDTPTSSQGYCRCRGMQPYPHDHTTGPQLCIVAKLHNGPACVLQKVAFPWGMWTPFNTWFVWLNRGYTQPAHNRFSRFCTARVCVVQHTHTHTHTHTSHKDTCRQTHREAKLRNTFVASMHPTHAMPPKRLLIDYRPIEIITRFSILLASWTEMRKPEYNITDT